MSFYIDIQYKTWFVKWFKIKAACFLKYWNYLWKFFILNINDMSNNIQGDHYLLPSLAEAEILQ